METSLDTVQFDTSARCDRCGSQAYHSATKGILELLFCAHHLNKYHNKLLEQEWEILTDITGLERIGPALKVG